MDAMIGCVVAVAILTNQAQAAAELRNAGQAEDAAEEAPWLRAGEGFDDEEMLMEEEPAVGVMRHSFRPACSAQGQLALLLLMLLLLLCC
jgi:hypothetical protein